MSDDDRPHDLAAEVAALRMIVGLILIELGNRDPQLREDIVAQLRQGAATGTTPIFPELEPLQLALQDFLDKLSAIESG